MNEIKEWIDGFIVTEAIAGTGDYSCQKTPYSLFVTKDRAFYLNIVTNNEQFDISTNNRKLSNYMMRRYQTGNIVVDTEEQVINVIKHLLGVEL